MKGVIVAVVLTLLTSCVVLAADVEYGPAEKVILHHSLAQGFTVESTSDSTYAYTMVTNGDVNLVLRRHLSDPLPTISFQQGTDAKMIVHAPEGVPACCAVFWDRFVNEEFKDCSTTCTDCTCMDCVGGPACGSTPENSELHLGPAHDDLYHYSVN